MFEWHAAALPIEGLSPVITCIGGFVLASARRKRQAADTHGAVEQRRVLSAYANATSRHRSFTEKKIILIPAVELGTISGILLKGYM